MKAFKTSWVIILLMIGVCAMAQAGENFKKATFAGGCFWCVESLLEKLDGVESVVSGYTGGQKKDPTYYEVASGTTGHAEALEVTYDPAKINYEKIVEAFWETIDPTQENGQFADKGSQYRTAIFYHDEEQKTIAEKSKADLEATGKFNKPIVTEIIPASTFYIAEEGHQNYSKKNPTHYQQYYQGSGRKPFLEKVWKKKS